MRKHVVLRALAVALICTTAFAGPVLGQRPRARDLGVPFAGEPGPLNAITDVGGVEVGHVTIVEGEVRTGATAIFPRRGDELAGTAAAVFAFNGTGEMTGSHFIEEFGAFFGPLVLTGTLGVGATRDGILRWTAREIDDPLGRFTRILPVVAETWDGGLSDAWSMALTPEHVAEALDAARGGPVTEGSVGGGTGMVCYQLKCGIGTSSRVVRYRGEVAFTVGVLVQANHGRRHQLRIAGVPVGLEVADLEPRRAGAAAARDGSIIIVVATDAPLLPSQLERLARRATIGMARTGGQGGSTSGDIFLAFTTANPVAVGSAEPLEYQSVPGEALDPLFDGVVQATEEAIVNALVAAEDMAGRGGSLVYALPHDRLQESLAGRGLLNASAGSEAREGHAAEIGELVRQAQQGAPYPALAVSVRRGEEVVYEAAHGLADLEHEAVATPDTVFQIGSLTKSFTGILIAQLAAEGAIDLDAPVGDYLSDYTGPARDVSVRRLMNHTAGLVNYTSLPDFPQGSRRRFSRREMRDFFEGVPLMFEPGTAFAYSNSGTFILGLIVEAVTGQEYGEALEARLLEPLGLTRTYYGDLQAVIPARAEGYIAGEEGFTHAPQLHEVIPFSAGALLSTVEDVQRYIDQVHRRNALGDAVRDILYTRETLQGGERLGYALGAVVIREFEGRRKIAHAGDIDGFAAYMSYYPDEDVSVVVMGNTRDVAPTPVGLEQKIARIVFGAPRPAPSGAIIDAAEVEALAGDYDAGIMRVGIDRIGIVARDGGIAARFGGVDAEGPAIPLVHLEGRHFLAAHDDEMAFLFAPTTGEVEALTVDWLGGGIPFVRKGEP